MNFKACQNCEYNNDDDIYHCIDLCSLPLRVLDIVSDYSNGKISKEVFIILINHNVEIKKEGSKRLTNKEWIDFLCEYFDISRTSAKDMFHEMMLVKKRRYFKKEFNRGRSEDKKYD